MSVLFVPKGDECIGIDTHLDILSVIGQFLAAQPLAPEMLDIKLPIPGIA